MGYFNKFAKKKKKSSHIQIIPEFMSPLRKEKSHILAAGIYIPQSWSVKRKKKVTLSFLN